MPTLATTLAVALLLGLTLDWNRLVGGAGDQRTNDAFVQGDLTPISAKVAGYVRDVPVADYQRVRRGQLLAAIVDDDYRAQVEQATANVAVARAAVGNGRAQRELQAANIAAADASADATRAQAERYRLDDRRQRALVGGGAASEASLEQSTANLRQTTAQVAQLRAVALAARRQVGVIDAQIVQAEANVAAAEAALHAARINLAYTRVVAPADGVLGQRSARAGQYVAAGAQINSLVPLPDVWVIANYKETQLTRVRLGERARITVDTYPGHRLVGRVVGYAPASGSQFALLPPDNATGNFTKVVQRISVKIAISDFGGLEGLLRPGMSVEATIETDGAPAEGRRDRVPSGTTFQEGTR